MLVGAFLVAAGCGSGPAHNALIGSVSHGSVDLPLDAAAGSNLPPSHIAANMVTVLVRDASTAITVIYVGGFEDQGGGSFLKHWDLTVGIVGEPIPGAVYQVTSAQLGASGAATILMQEASGTWKGASGSIAVNSAVGETVAFAFDGVTMAPQGDGAIGTFSMSGTLTINNIDDVCNCIN